MSIYPQHMFLWRDKKKYFPGPKVIKLFSYSTQLSMKFSLLINMKMPTIGYAMFSKKEFGIVSYLRFIGMENFLIS